MENTTLFYITYDVYFFKGNPLRDKVTIVKKGLNELHAQEKLQKFLKKKYGEDFKKMEVTKCIDGETAALDAQKKIMDTLSKFYKSV